MGAMSPTHWLIVIGVVVLLFGAKRLPDAARSLGRSARILKAEVKEMDGAAAAPSSETPSSETPSTAASVPAAPLAAAPPVASTPAAASGADRTVAG